MEWMIAGGLVFTMLGAVLAALIAYRLTLWCGRALAERHAERRLKTASAHGLSVLAERYAKGEIDETEYKQRRSALTEQ